MKFLIPIIALVMGVFAFNTMSGIGGPPFDFENATVEERQAFMDQQAATLKKASRFMLPSGRGPMALNFYLDEVKTNARTRELEMMIRVKVPYGAEVSRLQDKEALAQFCKNYVRTAMYKHDVRLIATFNKEKGGQLLRLRVTPGKCDRALGRDIAET